MEAAFVLDSNNDAVITEFDAKLDKPKVEKTSKDSIGSSGRKKLADISNMQPKPSTSTHDNKSRPNSVTAKEYIEQLQKENAALVKLLADKNKIIELSGAELHKLRITLQKMQQQNLQLAQSNSRMLAELNSGKDRLKDMQHQLGCKTALLIAKELESEGKRKNKTCQTNDLKKAKVCVDNGKEFCMIAEKDKDQNCGAGGRQKSKSLGPCARKVQDKGVGDNGSRVQGRRQSARFKAEEATASEDVYDTEKNACRLNDDRMREDVSNSVNKKEAVEERRRSSISRPPREAAKKVQSYKEMNVNVKLRRPE